MNYPFGVSESKANQIFSHESRTSHGNRYRGGKDNLTLLWKSVLAKYQLTVLIDSAENLAKKDFFGLSDPYVKMSFRGPLSVFPYFTSLYNDPVRDHYKTKTIPKTLDPKWNSSFKFAISGTKGTIIFDCYDENVLIPDDFLGRVYFTFNLTNPDSPYYVAVQPAAGEASNSELRDYVLEEKYKSDVIDRLPYLRDIKKHYRERRRSRKDHKIKGKLKLRILFEERNRWENMITSFGPFFGHHQDASRQVKSPITSWEAREHSDGRIFYIDHNTKSTQWVDPRLELKNKPTAKIEYDRNYRQKYINFRTKLKQKPNMPNKFEWTVSRSSLLEDSYNAIMSISNTEHLKSRLYVTFKGELGLDYGGLAREWFYLLSHEMFSPYYGLFEYSASDDYTLQINPDSGFCNENHLDYFKFVGRVCGMAVYHSKLIDAFFIRPFYKMMLGKRIALSDMQSVDIEFYNSLKYILDDDPEPLCLRFTATRDHYGEVTEVELKPGGSAIAVTERNRREYVNLMLKWRFKDRIQVQMDAFLKGFSQIIPLDLIKVFDEKELEYLMGGLAEIDVEDWKRNTEYNNYNSTNLPIVWFWKAVETFDNETRARLLQFVTGTSKVPMNGFSELQGSNGPKRFTIKKLGTIDSLPCAHTCFNRLDLPAYKSYYDLKEKLKLAVDNTEGFDIE